jgi:hypothetical protein
MFSKVTENEEVGGEGAYDVSFDEYPNFSKFNRSFDWDAGGTNERNKASALRAANAYVEALKLGLNAPEYAVYQETTTSPIVP